MIRSGFHNSLGTDIRTYYNSDFSHLMSLMIKDGIHQNYGHQFITLPGSGLEVIVQTGECWFNEVWVRNDADLPITVPAAPIVSGYSRIDAVAIKIDNTTAVREGTIEYVAGTASSSPVAPTLTDTDDIHWHLICLVTVPANATSISAANIENKIGTTTTPFITGILNTIDITTLLNQWSGQFSDWMNNNDTEFQDWFSENTSEFQTWFQRMKDQLSEDAAGHLQNEITDLTGMLTDNIEETSESSQAYAVDDVLAYDGSLYEVIDVINEGDTLVENTNIHQTTVSKLLTSLKTSFSSALTALKNTAIAQAVGATGNTFTSVIAKLGEIVNRGAVTTSIGIGQSYTIPDGYHNGQGKVSNSVPDARNSSKVATLTNADGRRVHSLREIWRIANSDGVTRTCFELPATGYYENVDIVAATDAQIKNLGWLIPSGTKSITANGNNQDVKNYAAVNVNVPNSVNVRTDVNWRYDQASGNTRVYSFQANSLASVNTLLVFAVRNVTNMDLPSVSVSSGSLDTLVNADYQNFSGNQGKCAYYCRIFRWRNPASSATITITGASSNDNVAALFRVYVIN